MITASRHAIFSEMSSLTDFTFIRHLGKGGFGRADLYQRKSDRTYFCIKFISLTGGASDKEQIKEANILSKMDHQNIIKYDTSFMEGNELCIVMEYASNGCLIHVCIIIRILLLHHSYLSYFYPGYQKRKTSRKPFTEREIFQILLQIVDGLACLFHYSDNLSFQHLHLPSIPLII